MMSYERYLKFYDQENKVVIPKIIPTDCSSLTGVSIKALFCDGWFPPAAAVSANAAGGGGEMGGTSHVPNVAFACTYVDKY